MISDGLTYYGPRKGWQLIDFRELWKFRDLVWAFGMRDLKVRYRQTAVGIAWAVIQPLFTVIVFGTLVTWLGGKATDGKTPYAVTSLCGMVPWQFFAAAVTQATLSIAMNAPLLKKVYFPRVILPLSAFVPAMVDFAITFLMLAAVMLFFGIAPSWKVVLLPCLVVATVLCAATFALWLSAVNAIYRDVQFAVPFALQLGMMISPVMYETDTVIPPAWHAVYYLNPLASLIQSYRAVLLGGSMPAPLSMAISVASMMILLLGGMIYFRRMERHFADLA